MRERELKVLVPGDAVVALPDDAVPGAVADPERPRTADDTYHDTPDLRLARWGVTLRWRESEGWTLKLPHPDDTAPGEGAVLDRAEITFPGPSTVPPPEAVALVAPLARSAPLIPVVQLTTERRARAWRRPDTGELVAELLDDRVSARTLGGVVGGPHRTTFREVEVELGPGAGDDEAGAALLADLADRLGLADAPPAVPKALRVLGAAVGPPDVAAAPLGDAPTAADVIRFALATSVARLLLHLPAARLGTDPEGVHQARVATRRLRSDLRTFRPLLDRETADRLRAELADLADALGRVRDADVLADTLRQTLARHPEIAPAPAASLFTELERQRQEHHRQLLDRLDQPATIELLDHLVAVAAGTGTGAGLVTAAGDGPAADVLAPLVAATWRKLHRAARRLGRHPDPADLHQVRIRAKRLRYAAEAAEPAFGRPAARFARHAAAIQDTLGRSHDAQVAAGWLAATAGTLPGPGAFAGGRLAQQLLADGAAIGDRRGRSEAGWRRHLRRLRRHRSWLSSR